MKKEIVIDGKTIKKDIKTLVNKADNLITNTIRKVNYELINMYWNIGKMIVEYKKYNKSKYGDAVVTGFSKELGLRYGQGFSQRNIKCSINLYQFFINGYPGNYFKNVFWSHYREIINIKNKKIIYFYLNEVENKKLTKLELRNYIKSKSYERTISNQRKGSIKNEIEKELKDPVILNIENKKRSEKELEKEILNNISNFKKEIGNYVMFFESQYKININGLNHKVDLVFFDNKINSYILVDLKINKVNNKDIFQMQMYIDYFNKHMKDNKFNNTIGIILCETKDSRLIENDNIYQIKYFSEIPKDKELSRIINDNKIILLKTEQLNIDD